MLTKCVRRLNLVNYTVYRLYVIVDDMFR